MKGFISKLRPLWVLLSLTGVIFVFLALGSALDYLNDYIFYAFDWKGYALLATVPLMLGLPLTISSLSEEERVFHFKMWYLYVIMLLFGFILYVTGILAFFKILDGTTQTAMGVDYSLFLLFSLIPSAIGSFLTVTAVREFREIIWKLRILWILFIVIGLLLTIVGYVTFMMNLEPGMKFLGVLWHDYLLFAGVPLVIGSGLFLGNLSEGAGELLWKFKYPGLLIFLMGLILFIISPITFFISSDPQPVDPVLSVLWNDWLVFALLPLGLGLALLVAPSSEDAVEFYSKLKFIFILLALLGAISYLLGIVAYMRLLGAVQELAGLQWDHWIVLGFILVALGLSFMYRMIFVEDYTPPALSRSAFSTDLATGGGQTADSVIQGKIKMSSEDQLAYFGVAKKIANYSKDQYKDSHKDGDLSDKAYRALSTRMNNAIKQYDKKIKEIKKQTEVKDRKRLFEQELGIPTKKEAEPAKTRVAKPVTTSPPIKTEKISPPPLQRPKIVVPDAQTFTPPPLAQKPKIIDTARRPTPPPAVTPAPTLPTATPPPADSGKAMDVVGTARSTSIAELRGEMLKELRRLRDIFKDEEE
ncbi:MAG: hypothetical protein ACXAEU_25890 [Candidatus Hodarchaeales archaeon]